MENETVNQEPDLTEVEQLRKQVAVLSKELETAKQDRDRYREYYQTEIDSSEFYQLFAKVIGNEDSNSIIDKYGFYKKR